MMFTKQSVVVHLMRRVL